MAEVHIAHDSEDIDFAELVEVRLAKAGYKASLDSEIPDAGSAWQKKLDQAIRKADIMVVIMTPEARASARVTYEWAFALGAGVRVITLELKPTPFHPRLDVLKRLDFTKKQRPWRAFLQEIEKAAGPTTTITVPSDAPTAIKNAVVALDSLKVNDQVAGVQSLAKMDHEDARMALAKALEHPVRTVRMTAAFKFPDRTDPRRLPGLIDCYRNNDSLRQWSQEMELDLGNLKRSFYSVDQIVSMGPPAAPYLLEVLEDSNFKVRAFAARVLGRIGETRAVPPLIDLLSDYNQPVRTDAARALGRIGETSAVPHLIETLGDKNENVRAAATRALGRIGHNAVNEMLAALEDDSVWVRAAAAEALGESQVRSAVPDLVEHLRKDSSKVRTAAALALGRIGDPVALTPLMEAFHDEADKFSITRKPAAEALGLLGDQRAVDALLAYLAARQNSEMREGNTLDFVVAEALLKLKCTDSIDLVGKVLGSFRSGKAPVCIVELLGSFGDDAVPVLTGLLNHRSLQETSAKILKEIGTTQALEALKKWRRSH
jgi:HEAT repeat protein